MGFTGFQWVFTEFSMGFSGLCLALYGFNMFLLGFAGANWVLLGSTGFAWILLSFSGCKEGLSGLLWV